MRFLLLGGTELVYPEKVFLPSSSPLIRASVSRTYRLKASSVSVRSSAASSA